MSFGFSKRKMDVIGTGCTPCRPGELPTAFFARGGSQFEITQNKKQRGFVETALFAFCPAGKPGGTGCHPYDSFCFFVIKTAGQFPFVLNFRAKYYP